MIDLIEIRDGERKLIGIIDTAISVIWHKVYYGIGDFEIYARATPEHLDLLKQNNYVTRPDENTIGIIERVNITNSLQDGFVIVASGRFAKSLLERRLIYDFENYRNKPTTLTGDVEENVRKVVTENAINCSFDNRRNMPILALGKLNNINMPIVDENAVATEIQTSHDNLLTFTDEILKQYELGAKVELNRDTYMLEYEVYKGTDRSANIVFSQEFDNLNSSDYVNDNSTERNALLIAGSGEDLNKFYSAIGATEGLKRRELFVDVSSQSKTMSASELQKLYPNGVFDGVQFLIDGNVAANLLVEDTTEYTNASLEQIFPNGHAASDEFRVGGVVYGQGIVGKPYEYTLTPIGYKAKLDIEENEGEYDIVNSRYAALINAEGRKELALNKATETFTGNINVTFSNWQLDRDFFLGDLVNIQDNRINKYVTVRITETTEVQDENGYSIDAVFE